MNFLSPAVIGLTFTNLPSTSEDKMVLLHCSCFVQDFSLGRTKSCKNSRCQSSCTVDHGASQHHLSPCRVVPKLGASPISAFFWCSSRNKIIRDKPRFSSPGGWVQSLTSDWKCFPWAGRHWLSLIVGSCPVLASGRGSSLRGEAAAGWGTVGEKNG